MNQYLDKWEARYLNNLKNKDTLAWSDEEAIFRYPKYSWVYNKLLLSKHTKLITFDLEKELPSIYPVIVKPIENLLGLSKNCYVAESFEEIEDYNGYIAQQYLYGTQYTTDLMILNGKVVAYYTFVTHKSKYDEIKCFVSTPFFSYNVRKKVEEILFDYTGIANVEYIEDSIIELHLRPSLQFYDICSNFISSMPEFIINNTVPKLRFEQTFSRVFRTRFNGKVLKSITPKIKPKEVRSVQLCWENNINLSQTDNSLFRKRYMVINGTDLNVINDYGRLYKIILGE